jgi:hypothetical protein
MVKTFLNTLAYFARARLIKKKALWNPNETLHCEQYGQNILENFGDFLKEFFMFFIHLIVHCHAK